MNFRIATITDISEMQDLYVNTIKSVCKKEYGALQIEAWISGANNHERWLDVVTNQFVFLAIIEGKIAGYGTLKDGNYIDLFFIHKDFQRKGIAEKIYNELENKAKNADSKFITADVSITAKPFFEKKGFRVEKEQHNLIKNVELINYKMVKEFES